MYDSYGSYGSSYDTSTIVAGSTALMGFMIIIWVIGMAAGIVGLISMIKIFKKAGKPWWAALIPIYNMVVMTEIAGLSGIYVLLLFIPFVNIYATIKIIIGLAKNFGKDTGFAILMILLPIIGFPVLAFSKCSYVGGGASTGTPNAVPNSNEPAAAEPVPDVVASPDLSSAPLDQSLNVETQSLTEVEQQNAAEAEPATEDLTMDNPQNVDASIQSVSSVADGGEAESLSAPEPAAEASPAPEPAAEAAPAPVEPTAEEPQPEASETAPTKLCPTCGSQVDANATTCPVCGSQLA